MFKIGNSKELPTIPDHLSSEGKDFVRKCLQRNPHNRPSASELLDHPFVKYAAPLERPILGPDASSDPAVSGITQGATALVGKLLPTLITKKIVYFHVSVKWGIACFSCIPYHACVKYLCPLIPHANTKPSALLLENVRHFCVLGAFKLLV